MQPSDVRPLPVLEETLNYVLNLIKSADYPFEVVHDFIFDRTRSIRQDISMQNIVNDKVVHMYEEMVCFFLRNVFSSKPLFSSLPETLFPNIPFAVSILLPYMCFLLAQSVYHRHVL